MNSELFFHGPKWLTNQQVQFKNVGEITQENISLDTEEVKKTFQMKGPQMNVLFASVEEEDDILKEVEFKRFHEAKRRLRHFLIQTDMSDIEER